MAATRAPVTDPNRAAEAGAPETPIGTLGGPNGPSRGVSRRSFLHHGAVAGGTALVVVTGGVGYRAYDEGVFQVGQGSAYDAWRSWNQQRGPMALVAAAILAANPHNTQAWIFRVSPQRIDLYADRSRNIGAVDPFRREMYVGLGCAVENLMLAAPANGYQAKLTLLPTPGQPVHAATIELARGPTRRSELYAQIPNRHTDRTAYQLRPVPTVAQHAMSALAADLPDTSLHWVTGAAERERMGTLMVAAAQALTEDRQQSLDDNRWFRHDWDAIQRFKDGLTIDAQGLPALTSTLAKLIPATSRQYNDSFWVKHTRDPQARTAAAYGIISVPDAHSNRQRLTGGRLLERIHLWTAGHGLSLGHMNQITERADRERQLGATPTFEDATHELVATRGTQQLVAFRVGYPATGDGSRLSPRRPTSEVTR